MLIVLQLTRGLELKIICIGDQGRHPLYLFLRRVLIKIFVGKSDWHDKWSRARDFYFFIYFE